MSYILGVLAGIGLPIQTSINTKLRKKVGTSYSASLISFVVALIFLVLLLIATGQGIYIPFEQLLKEPLWIWMGGICGVIFLTGNILLLSKVGSVQTVVLPVLGQILMGLAIDSFGLFHAEQSRITLLRIVGAILVIVGVLIVSMSKDIKKGTLRTEFLEVEEEIEIDIKKAEQAKENLPKGQYLWIWRMFGVVAGMLSAMQIAVNGYLGKVVESPVKASAISFVIGIICLGMVCIATSKQHHSAKTTQNKTEKHPLWIWFGGILGGLYILANVTLSGKIGTGMTVIVLLIGATTGGLMVDHFAMFGSDKKPINAMKVIGVLVMIAGAVAIKLF